MSVAKGFRLSDDSTAKLDWNYVTNPDGSKSIIEEVNDVKQDLEELQNDAGVTADLKSALLDIAENIAYINQNGHTLYDNLYNALYPNASSITCVYTQTGTVYTTDTLDSLKDDLVVTAHYSDSTTKVLKPSDYTLTGALASGTSTITVHYGNLVTTFTVTVTYSQYSVTNTLSNCSTSNNATLIDSNDSYSATITPSSGYSLYDADVTITMGGVDVTSTAYSNGTISIATVTGDLAITITCYVTIQWDMSKGRVPSTDDGVITTNGGNFTEVFDSTNGLVITGTSSNNFRYDIADYQYVKKATFEMTFTPVSMTVSSGQINPRFTSDGSSGCNLAVTNTPQGGYHVRYILQDNNHFDIVTYFEANQEYTMKIDVDYNTDGKTIIYWNGTKVHETATPSSYYASSNRLFFIGTMQAYVKSFRWVIKEGTLNG